jgi:excisionase family DNA binding protein
MSTEFFTTKEIATQMKVTPETITTWIRAGKLAARKIGGRYRVSENGLKSFLGDTDAFFKTLTEAIPEE